jgi:WhiB family redox-sensing transcriptional regulator
MNRPDMSQGRPGATTEPDLITDSECRNPGPSMPCGVSHNSSSHGGEMKALDPHRVSWRSSQPAPTRTPLTPIADLWSWQLSARCRGEDPAVFFPAEGERGHVRSMRQTRAKAICAQCTVLTQCRDHSLRCHEPFGVWGGIAEDERAALLGKILRRQTSTT